jgi:hypothetical protein
VGAAYREALEDGLGDDEAQAKVLSDFAADLADVDGGLTTQTTLSIDVTGYRDWAGSYAQPGSNCTSS